MSSIIISPSLKATLVKIELLTGRTHQIRVHSASMGNFVIGDKKYGNKAVNLKFKKIEKRIKGICKTYTIRKI